MNINIFTKIYIHIYVRMYMYSLDLDTEGLNRCFNMNYYLNMNRCLNMNYVYINIYILGCNNGIGGFRV